jgi:redox-sensitive bicupin YhaK (pirin superfamily)
MDIIDAEHNEAGIALNTRPITHQTRGYGHGPIVRLMSPSDLGEILKPFVFLDLFEGNASFADDMPIHPHSGIATVTLITEGNLRFKDADSGIGHIGYGGVEWMRAGAGVWHGHEMSPGTSARIQGFQLWVALPSALEHAPVQSQYLEAHAIPQVGPARVILGSYENISSPVHAPDGITYLLVTLKAGERWQYQPPAEHNVLWLSVSRGIVRSSETRIEAGELAVFEKGNNGVALQAGVAKGATFVIGSAVNHPHDLVLGDYSVHTTPEALKIGEAKINELSARVRVDQMAGVNRRNVSLYT